MTQQAEPMSDPHDPRSWSWPFGMPESLASTDLQVTFLECPHKNDRKCEYKVRIHRKAHDFTLKQHLATSCPLRSDPGYVVPAGLKPFSELA